MEPDKYTIKQSPLFEAFEDGDYDRFCQLIKDGENINCVSVYGESLISNVVENKFEIDNKQNKKFFNKLMSLNVSLLHGKNECDLLSTAIRFQPDIYYMKKLLEKGIKINSLSYFKDEEEYEGEFENDEDGVIVYGPSIYEAFLSLDSKKIDLLLKYKPDLEVCDSNRRPVLSFLILKKGYFKKLIDPYFPILIENGASVFDTDLNGKQPIHYWALSNANKNIFNLLVKNKVNINAKDTYGNTPLMDAVLNDNYESVSILIKNNVDLNMQGKDGRTAMMLMAVDPLDINIPKGFINTNILNIFLSSKSNFLLCDNQSENIAHYVARCPYSIWDQETIKKFSKLFKKYPQLISQKMMRGKLQWIF